MKKNRIYIIIAALLVVVSLVIILYKKNVFSQNKLPQSDIFAVKDTADITKIFLADMHGNNLLLQKNDGCWFVKDTIPVLESKMNYFLAVVHNLTIRQTVVKTAQSNINKMLSAGSIKCEIYQNAPKFSLFGKKFFVKERKVKTYYMGPATMDNLSSFAVLEGYDEPFAVCIPGFRGFPTPNYSVDYTEWMTHDIFSTKITRIQSVEVKDYDNPEQSFKIVKSGTRFFDLYNADNEKIMDYDTLKLLDMLTEFRDKNFEMQVFDLTATQVDSVFKYGLFKELTLTDVNGEVVNMLMYRKVQEESYYIDDIFTYEDTHYAFNRDKFYAVINHNFNNLYQCQYFHFDRQLQPLSYFVDKKKL